MPFTSKDLNMGYNEEELAQMQRVFDSLVTHLPPSQHQLLKSAIINEAGNSDDLQDLLERVRQRLKLQTR